MGIAAVHQEPNVVPALSPVANVFLGNPAAKAGFLRPGEMRQRFLRWTQLLGTSLPTGGRAGDLSLGAQQTIEIIRALELDARILLMDEPTSSLGPEERRGLFRMIDSMLDRDLAIVFISHKLDDVLAVATTVSVLRDGERVAQVEAAKASPELLIHAMLGRTLEEVLDHGTPPASARPGAAVGPSEVCGCGASPSRVCWMTSACTSTRARSSALPGSLAPAVPRCCAHWQAPRPRQRGNSSFGERPFPGTEILARPAAGASFSHRGSADPRTNPVADRR